MTVCIVANYLNRDSIFPVLDPRSYGWTGTACLWIYVRLGCCGRQSRTISGVVQL